MLCTQTIISSKPIFAQTSPQILTCSSESTLTEFKTHNQGQNQKIVTKDTISQDNLTDPSLWWTAEQFNLYGGRLIDNWIADSDTKVIDLVVNRQLWSYLNYLERYTFVNKFGTVAREYGYRLRVFDSQETCVASYSYDSQDQKWQIHFVDSFDDRFQL